MLKSELSEFFDKKRIVDDPDILDDFSTDFSFTSPSRPDLAVQPKNKEEVQSIVAWANENHIPLIPVSSGGPRFHGDTIASKGGVIIDFSRMNRILKIDPTNRSVMIEPGVTYAELIPELKRQGLRLNMTLLPRPSKSVLTSCLEREPRLIPKYQYDYLDPLLTLEVIYGTGDDFRTGSASGPGSLDKLKADKVNPWGPGSIDFFRFVSGAQGTMGLVTWAVVKAEISPSLQKVYFIPIQEAEDLSVPLSVVLKKRIVDECLILNNVNFATILAQNWPEDFNRLKKILPPWTIVTSVAGYQRRPDERIKLTEKYLLSICHDLGLTPLETLPGTSCDQSKILDLLSSPWTEKPYWKLRPKGACHDIFFLTTLSQVAIFIKLMKETTLRHHYPYDEIGCTVYPMVQGRGCHCEFNLPYTPSHPGEGDNVRHLFLDASEVFLKNGAFFSRPYGPWADMVYSRYPQGVAALKKLKGIFDPNHILNPGKLCF